MDNVKFEENPRRFWTLKTSRVDMKTQIDYMTINIRIGNAKACLKHVKR